MARGIGTTGDVHVRPSDKSDQSDLSDPSDVSDVSYHTASAGPRRKT